MLEFGQKIKAKREAKGLTQKQLGQLVYVSDKTVSRWENNQTCPDITMLLELAKVLEFDYQELLEGEAYIQRLLLKKQNRKYMIIIILFLLVMSASICTYSINRYKEELGKDYIGVDFLASNTWNSVFISDVEGESESHKSYSDYQQQKILSYLNVDGWTEISQIPDKAKRAYIIYFFNQLKEERYSIYLADNQSYIVFEYDDFMNGHKLFWEYKEYNKMYECHTDLTNFVNFIKKLPQFDFIYDHKVINNTEFRQLSTDEIMDMDEDYYTYIASGGVTSGKLLLRKDGPYYLYFSSKEENITSMSFIDGVIELRGEKRMFNKPYVCVFEIDNPDDIKTIQYNGKSTFSYGVDFSDQH